MKEFWINNGWDFLWIEGFIICIIFFSSQFYTGSVRKLDLMITDIKEKGEVSFNTLYFNTFFNNNKLDRFNLSTITHLYFPIPGKNKEPQLYANEYFLMQLKKVLLYRRIYKYLFIFLFINLLAITTMTFLYGQDIK